MQTNPFLKNTDLIPLIKAPYTSFYVETSKACCALLCLVLIYVFLLVRFRKHQLKENLIIKILPQRY